MRLNKENALTRAHEVVAERKALLDKAQEKYNQSLKRLEKAQNALKTKTEEVVA